MVFVIVETISEYPLTPEEPTEEDLRTLECVQERNGTWKYSLLSLDRHRMICIFDAPDAESIRESYQRGGTMFSSMWSGTLVLPEGNPPQRKEGRLKVLLGYYPNGLSQEDWDDSSEKILPCYAEREAEWLQSYVSRDRTRTVCEINAPDAEVIREVHRRFDIPFERVWSAMVIKPDNTES